jgi:transmembrane sensor
MILPDGSRVELAADSRMTIDEYSDAKVQLSLSQGHAQLEVAHQLKRPFVVEAADYEIRVVGTRFTVKVATIANQPVVNVDVQQGKVRVRDRRSPQEDVSVLVAGQSWTSGRAVTPAAANATADALGPDERGAADPSPSTLPGNDTSVEVDPPSTGDFAKIGPRELLQKAEQQRIRGKLRDSADLLNRLRSNYRSDPRASLAAFELGRMRMDTFGDLNGSVEALRDAIALNPSATFREDAESRLVQIYYRQGNLDKCRAAKNAYLKRFPSGAASGVVSRLCDP